MGKTGKSIATPEQRRRYRVAGAVYKAFTLASIEPQKFYRDYLTMDYRHVRWAMVFYMHKVLGIDAPTVAMSFRIETPTVTDFCSRWCEAAEMPVYNKKSGMYGMNKSQTMEYAIRLCKQAGVEEAAKEWKPYQPEEDDDADDGSNEENDESQQPGAAVCGSCDDVADDPQVTTQVERT